jgi:hypothetical protein
MKTSTNVSLIRNLINDSTWVRKETNTTLQFSNGKDLAINGQNHMVYSLKSVDNKTIIQLDKERVYYIDFVNDFTLSLHNQHEQFQINPE